jgi:alpha-galactosidase
MLGVFWNCGVLVLLCCFVTTTAALRNGIAITPPRGVTTWLLYDFNVSATKLESLADGVIDTGLAASGYDIIWLDDGWPSCSAFSGLPGESSCATPAPRAANGSIVVDSAKFPQGMAATVAYIHSKGLRVGIYTAPHAVTCGGYTASLNYEGIDASTFVAWGVDAVKLDAGCRNDASLHDGTLLASIGRFRDALNATGKPVLLYVDDGNPVSGAKVTNPMQRGVRDNGVTRTHFARTLAEFAPSWCGEYAHMCKIWFDRWDSFGSLMDNVHQQINLAWFQGPGCFIAPDQMTIGQGKMTLAEERSEVALYTVLGAPMFVSAAPTRLSVAQLELITNPELRAVNEDSDCTMGSQLSSVVGDAWATAGDRWAVDLWVKPLNDSSFAFVAVNRDPHHARNATLRFGDGDTGSGTDLFPAGAGTRARLRDLLARKDLGEFEETWSAIIPPHDAVAVRVFPM